MIRTIKLRLAWLVCLLFLSSSLLTCESAAESGGEAVVQAFTRLFQDDQLETRLEACFLAAGLPEHPEYTKALRHNLVKANALERAVTLYALAAMTRSPQDIEAFLNFFPKDSKRFWALMDAEWQLSATLNTGMANFLWLLVYEPTYSNKAIPALLRIATNVPMESMDNYLYDPVVEVYAAAHPEETDLLELEDMIELKCTGACEKAVIELMNSKDSKTRVAAIIMSWGMVDTDAMAKEKEKIQLTNSIYDVLIKKAVNINSYAESIPLDKETVEELFRLEAELYHAPLDGLAGTLYTISRNSETPSELNAIQAMVRYAKPYLENIELLKLQEMLAKNFYPEK